MPNTDRKGTVLFEKYNYLYDLYENSLLPFVQGFCRKTGHSLGMFSKMVFSDIHLYLSDGVQNYDTLPPVERLQNSQNV